MKNGFLLTLGWFTAVQGGLGAGGLLFGDGPWGLIPQVWDAPMIGYIAVFLAGGALALVCESARMRARTS